MLRWTWRVSYYSYSALGTDQYPPFSLGADAPYPATLEVDYPGTLSRRLVLVKWWLLAIPQYILVAFFQGGVSYYNGGLIGVLVLFAAISLLVTGRYPHLPARDGAQALGPPRRHLRRADDRRVSALLPAAGRGRAAGAARAWPQTAAE